MIQFNWSPLINNRLKSLEHIALVAALRTDFSPFDARLIQQSRVSRRQRKNDVDQEAGSSVHSTPKHWKTVPASWGRKTFENGTFRKREVLTISVTFLKHMHEMTNDCGFLKFRCSVHAGTENIWCLFNVKSSFSNPHPPPPGVSSVNGKQFDAFS